MSDYSITNHVAYKQHMKNFVPKKLCRDLLNKKQKEGTAKYVNLRKRCRDLINKTEKEGTAKYVDLRKRCNQRLSKVQALLGKQQDVVSALEGENGQMRSQLKTLLKHCAPPKKSKCPITPFEQHPDYIVLKKREAEAKEHLRQERLKAEQTNGCNFIALPSTRIGSNDWMPNLCKVGARFNNIGCPAITCSKISHASISLL